MHNPPDAGTENPRTTVANKKLTAVCFLFRRRQSCSSSSGPASPGGNPRSSMSGQHHRQVLRSFPINGRKVNITGYFAGFLCFRDTSLLCRVSGFIMGDFFFNVGRRKVCNLGGKKCKQFRIVEGVTVFVLFFSPFFLFASRSKKLAE